MPKEQSAHGSLRSRKPYDRPPPKAPPTHLSKRPHAPSPLRGGGIGRSTSLLGSLARLVSNPLGWLRGTDDVAEEGADEGDMELEAEEGGFADSSKGYDTQSGPPKAQPKRRPSDGATLPEDNRRKRLRLYSPPRAGPSHGGYGDVPDLATSLAKKRDPARKKQPSGELMPPPPAPTASLHDRYDPRHGRADSRSHSVDMDQTDVGPTPSRVHRHDYHSSLMESITPRSPDARFGRTPRTPFGRAGSVQPSSSVLRPDAASGSVFRREGSMLSDRMSDVMSVDTIRTSQMEDGHRRLTASAHHEPHAPRQPASLGPDSAEAILRALESFRTPLSSSRAPVLPASRINVPIPDKHKLGAPSPYARPFRRRVGDTTSPSKSKDAAPRENDLPKPSKGKERADEGGSEKDTAMVTDEPSEEKSRDAQKTEPEPSTAKPDKTKDADTNKIAIDKARSPAQPATTLAPLPIPSGPMIPIPKVALPAVPAPAGTSDDTGFKVVDSYDTKGKSSLRVAKQAITRRHESAAGSERKKAEGQGQDAARPAKRGTNVFKLPDDDDDEDIAEKPEAPATSANLPDPKTVAEWFKPPSTATASSDVAVKPVVEPKDFFKESLARLENKASPLPPVPALFGAMSGTSAPTSLVFNANISGSQPTIQFGAPKTDAVTSKAPTAPTFGSGPSPFQLAPPKPADAQPSAPAATGSSPFQPPAQFGSSKPADTTPKPSLGAGPSHLDSILKASSAPSTPPAATTKPSEPPKFTFTKPADTTAAETTTPAKPIFGTSPSPFGSATSFGAFSAPQPSEGATSTSGAPTPITFGKPSGAPASAGTSTFSFGAPAAANTGGNSNALQPAAESKQPSATLGSGPSPFGVPSNPTTPSPVNGVEAPKPSTSSTPAFGSGFGAGSSAFTFKQPASNDSKPAAFGTAPPSWNAFGQVNEAKKTGGEEKTEVKQANGFGGFGSSFGAATNTANSSLTSGTNTLGLTTASDASTSKPAFSLFGAGESKPAPTFGSAAFGAPAPANAAAPVSTDAEKPKTPPPTNAPSPDKMETSPVREPKVDPMGSAAATTTPSGAPAAKPIFPTFGLNPPTTNLFGSQPTATLTPAPNKETGAPANPFGAATSGSTFSFNFGGSNPAPNPFAGASAGGSIFGNPFAKSATETAGASAPAVPTFGAHPSVGTPERPQSSGFTFGAPATTGFTFGAPAAQPSPFGGSSTGLPSGTPPLTFGVPGPSADGTGTPGLPSPAVSGSFNLGAADPGTGRKVKALPNRRKRM